MSDREFEHNQEKRDAWKKMSEWSHSISDDELTDLFSEDDFSNDFPVKETIAHKFGKFVIALIGLSFGLAFFSFVFYRLAIALGVDTLSFGEAVIITVGVALIRYADAGVMKQLR